MRFLIAVSLLALSSCVSRAPVSQGDATREGAIGSRLTNFWTERFPIGRTGVHELEITGLTASAYPEKVRVYTREFDPSGWRGYTRWDRTVLQVELLDYHSGKTFLSRTRRLDGYRQVGAGRYEVRLFQREELPTTFRENYRIRIRVLTASPRAWDEASLLLR